MLLLACKNSEEERAYNSEGSNNSVVDKPSIPNQRSISSANITSCYATKSFILHDLETIPKTESSFGMSFS